MRGQDNQVIREMVDRSGINVVLKILQRTAEDMAMEHKGTQYHDDYMEIAGILYKAGNKIVKVGYVEMEAMND